jgi:hypothetical protein
MEKKKPKWGTPNLIILTKGKDRQESVLSTCKVADQQVSPSGLDSECIDDAGSIICHVTCTAIVAS